MKRKPERLDWYLLQIQQLWPDFKNDGLSGGFPDWIYRRWNLSLADIPHAWHYCTRCHPAGSMTYRAKKFADRALRQHARQLLPWWIRIAPVVLYYGVIVGAHSSWDSCGPEEGERCRHNIKKPVWMQASGDA